MNMPRVENRWSIGNILTLIGLGLSMSVTVVGLNTAMARMEEGLKQVRESDRRHEMEMSAMRVDAAARESRIRALENATSRMDERLVSILATLQRIERAIEGSAR